MKRDLFADHSANERTFLSWVRTALSIIGFGLLVAKFGDPVAGARTNLATTALLLLLLGMALVLAAGARFMLLRKQISEGHPDATSPALLDITLVVSLVTLLATLASFCAHLIVTG
jgi:putative membrane protein